MASNPRAKRTPARKTRNTPTQGTVKAASAPKISYVRRRDCAKPTKVS